MPKRYKVAKRSGTDNLQLRYYVPVEYQEAFGKREVVRSLKTTDSRLAHERALDVVKELDRKVKAAQTSNVEPDCGHFYEPSHEKIEAAAREVYESEVEADWEERSDPEHMRLMGLGGKISAKSYKREAKKLRQAASMGDFSVADIEYWSDHFGFQFPANNVKRNRFHKLLAYAYAEAAERWAKHDMGKRGGKPTTPELRRPKLVAASPQGDTRPQKSDKIPDPSNSLDQPTLGDLWDSHERQRGARVKPATLTDRKVSVRLFADYLGQGTPVTSISKEDARNWRDLLYKLPTNSAQRKELEHLDLKEIIKRSEQLGLPTISTRTLAKHISGLNTFFQWLIDEGRVTENIFVGLAPDISRRGKKAAEFSNKQLRHLFKSPLYTGCAGTNSIKEYATSGTLLIRDWRFWLPLLSAFSGARLGELAQLHTSDIGVREGINYIDINDADHFDKSIKSEWSNRIVPIHSQLQSLGFAEPH